MTRDEWKRYTPAQREQMTTVALFNLPRRGLDVVTMGEIQAISYALEDALAYIEELETDVRRYNEIVGKP